MDDEVEEFERSYCSGICLEEMVKSTKTIEPTFMRKFSVVCIWSRGSSVSIVSRLRAGGSGLRS